MEIIIIIALILLNGLFAMTEIAIVSSRKARLEEKAKSGSKNAKLALKLSLEPEKFLSAIQVGITLVGIISGVYGGVALTEDLIPHIEKFHLLKPYAEEISYLLIVGTITYFSLVIGELVPKTIALNNAENIAILFAPALNILTKIAYPVIQLLSISTKLFIKLFRIKVNENPPVTEEELKMLIDQGATFGSIEKKESELLKRVFKFGDRKANSIMTQRNDVIWLDVNDNIEVTRKTIFENEFAIYPVCNGSLDDVLGVITAKDFYKELNNVSEIRSLMKEPIYVIDSFSAYRILEILKEKKNYNAFVIDEYGVFQGIITLRDIVENIVGDIPQHDEKEEHPVIKRDDGSFLVDGGTLLDDLLEQLPLDIPKNLENYITIAGYILNVANKIPAEGEKFISGNFSFEIIDMDGKRIDKLLITKINSLD
jgi:putative hemolysin